MIKFNLRKSVAIAIYTVLVAGIGSSCSADNNRVQKDTIESSLIRGIEIVTVDNCEYIWIKRGYAGGLTHKGNCKNPEHARH